MFRELVRKDKELPFDECIKILTSEKRGVFSVLGDNGNADESFLQQR